MLKIPDSGLQSSQCRMQVPPGRAVGGDPLNTTPSLKQLLRLGAEDIVPPGPSPWHLSSGRQSLAPGSGGSRAVVPTAGSR